MLAEASRGVEMLGSAGMQEHQHLKHHDGHSETFMTCTHLAHQTLPGSSSLMKKDWWKVT